MFYVEVSEEKRGQVPYAGCVHAQMLSSAPGSARQHGGLEPDVSGGAVGTASH